MARNRGGRPRKDGPRYPSGARRPEDAREVALAQRRKYGATKDDAAHAEWECPLGRALKAGHISREAYEAGVAFRNLDADYRRVNGLAPPRTKAADWDRGGRLLRPDDDPEWAARVMLNYKRAIDKIERGAGLAARHEVVFVCVYEREPMMMGNLIAGLEALK